MLFPSFQDKKGTVLKMISWKDSFERLNEEYDITKRKKQALDNLLNDSKISQSTYDSFNRKIDEAVAEIERQQRALLEKMNSKTGELEQHIKTLEVLLATFEIRHVTGEIDEEVYQREVNLLSTGLDVARQELDTVKEAVNELSSSIPIPITDTVVTQETEPQTTEDVEAPQHEMENIGENVQAVELERAPEENVEQNLPEPPIESVEGGDTETFQNPQEPQETWQNTEETEETVQSAEEETQSTETVAEGEETQE